MNKYSFFRASAYRYVRFCLLTVLTIAAIGATAEANNGRSSRVFQRISTFPVFLNTDIDTETVSEIVDASKDGRTLIYTDSENDQIGFIDISNPNAPAPAGTLDVGGEPTSVAVRGRFALVSVNTSPDFVNPSGLLQIVNVRRQTIVRTLPLGGQPDAIAVSPDMRYAAIAIENERDEDLGDGRPPQLPAGFLTIVDTRGPVSRWSTRDVELTGIADLFPEDPEPEFVDINRRNIAVVTLQENNHIVFVDLRSGQVTGDFSAGAVDLFQIDTVENELIEPVDMQLHRLREPDAVAWISDDMLATADEGDLDGGSRGFTVFDTEGNVLFAPGNSLEHLVTRIGHYPEDRSENKGNEPEAVEYARFGSQGYLFVGSERSSVVAVYRVKQNSHRGRGPWAGGGNGGKPRLEVEFVQVLPAGVAPEGVRAIPQRNLLAVASEADDRGDKFRSGVTLYRLRRGESQYPTMISEDRADGTPIPWGAQSGIAGDLWDDGLAYTVYDSFYRESRIFVTDVSDDQARIVDEIVLMDNGSTLDLDPEGIAVRPEGGFWVVSEGRGSVDDANRPVESLNLLLQVADDGTVLQTVTLPASVNALQRRFGFEGVSAVGEGDDELVYVAFQREWVGDPDDHVRIGRYEVATGEWTFYYYPIEAPLSANGGWVGNSEIVATGPSTFAVIERDNQGGPDAAIKRIYEFSVAGLVPQPQGGTFPVVSKSLVRDLIPDLKASNGAIIEKVEGLGVLADGDVVILTDNDGVDDSSGETLYKNLGPILGTP